MACVLGEHAGQDWSMLFRGQRKQRFRALLSCICLLAEFKHFKVSPPVHALSLPFRSLKLMYWSQDRYRVAGKRRVFPFGDFVGTLNLLIKFAL
jgi:hypothetical protein